MKTTDWIPGDIKPVHPGVYQVRPPRWIETVYAHWNVQWWGDCAYSPEWAKRYQHKRNDIQRLRWRGLAEKP